MALSPEIVEKAREHYGAYYLQINPSYKYVRYQQEIIVPALEGLERGDYDRLMVLMRPGESKTRLCTAGFAPWLLGRRPDREILIVSYGDKPASQFGQTVRDQLRSDIHHEIFPWCHVRKDVSARTYFQTDRDGKIYAVGWGGAIARIRADYVLIDDPLKNYEEATSDVTMEARMRTFDSVVTDRLKPGGKIVVCTNRWAPRDFVGRIFEKDRDRWKVVILMAEPDPKSEQATYFAPGNRFLWEEFHGAKVYIDAKKDQWKWETTCQQRPENALPQRFERQWIQVYTDQINPGRFHVWIICDPALSQHKHADRTCIMALAGGPENKLFLVDLVLDRLNPDERTKALIKMADHWEADAILYEETGMSSDSFYLDRDIEKYGINCPVIPVGRRGARHMRSKDSRIADLIQDFREKRIVLPGVEDITDDGGAGVRPRFIYKQKDGVRVDLMAYAIEQEYIPWSGKGSLPHDEFLDALSRIKDPEFQMTYDEGTPKAEDGDDAAYAKQHGIGMFEGRVSARGGATWFSR